MTQTPNTLVVHLVGASSDWAPVAITAAATLLAAFLAFLGSQQIEHWRAKNDRDQKRVDRQEDFELGLLGEIQSILDELSSLNAENASRLIDSKDDRSAKLTHMARVSGMNERLKLRCAHFGMGPLYSSLDQVAKSSTELAGADDFDTALSANARLYLAFDTASAELAKKRREVLGTSALTTEGSAADSSERVTRRPPQADLGRGRSIPKLTPKHSSEDGARP